MSFTWDEIEVDWLMGSTLAATHDDVVESFNRVEQMLGRDWVLASRTGTGGTVSRGTSPTLHIVNTGQLLGSLEGIPGHERLVSQLRQNDRSGHAEAIAIHLLRSPQPGLEIELYPTVRVGRKQRQPDFRVRQAADEPWVYVEVTAPDASEEYKAAEAVLDRVAGWVHDLKRAFALEVFLRRMPSEAELESLADRIRAFCVQDGNHQEPIPGDLGLLLLNHSLPGHAVMAQHPGEENCPRISCMTSVQGPNEPQRHIVVRMAYSDQRAASFLRHEAQQLPIDSPGLIIAAMSGAPGGMRSWEPLLRRRLHPGQHTRVSAICLFEGGHEPTPGGEAWVLRTKLLRNARAKMPLPDWTMNALQSYPRPWHDILATRLSG